MLSPSLCANEVTRIELREADAQEELRQDAEQWESMAPGADLLPEATPASGRSPPLCPAAQHCSAVEAASQVPGGDAHVAEAWELQGSGKGWVSHFQGPDRPAPIRVETSGALLVPPFSPVCG